MALIKHAQAAEIARQAIVLDLGDLHRQGSVIVQRAREQAAAIIEEAKRERERIVAGGKEEGHRLGFEQGITEGRARGEELGRAEALLERQQSLRALEASWEAALGVFTAEREHMLAGAGRDVIRLAAAVAEKVAKRAVTLDAHAVEAQIEAVLSLVVRPTALVLRVHPDDRELAASALPALLARFPTIRHAELADDPELARGSCVASCRDPGDSSGIGGEIDASIDVQVDRIVRALLPGDTGVGSAGEGGGGGA